MLNLSNVRAPRPCTTTRLTIAAFTACVAASSAALAAPVPQSPINSQYLLVARQSVNGQVTVDTDNFELGANKAPVPATDNFIADKIGDSPGNGGPTLLGAVPDLPSNAAPVFSGVGGHGNIAVTDPDGFVSLQDVGVYADPGIGIRLSAPDESYNQTSNSFFNDPNMFPNTYDPNTGTGVFVKADPDSDPLTLNADQSTRIDPSGNGNPSDNIGITYGYDHSALDAELASLRTEIGGLAATNTFNVSNGNAGELESNSSITGAGGASISFAGANSLGGVSATITAVSGLNVIDVNTGSNDFLLNNANLVVDGPSDAFVIFRLVGDDNMLLSNSNILAGQSIGQNNILFFTDQLENDQHFNMNNVILNGAAFWSLGSSDIAEINVNNAQGCTQFIAEDISLSDVRFNRCMFAPEPGTAALLMLGAAGLMRRRV